MSKNPTSNCAQTLFSRKALFYLYSEPCVKLKEMLDILNLIRINFICRWEDGNSPGIEEEAPNREEEKQFSK